MKRSLLKTIPALLCALLLFAVALPALAEVPGINAYAVVTNTSNLNIRTGPGTEYAVIGNVPQGTQVGVLSEYGNWYQVYVPSVSLNGYMSKKYLTPVGASAPTQAPAAPVTAIGYGVVNNPNPSSFLNLRQYPSLDAPVLGIYYNGASFALLSTTSDGWYQVRIGDQTGYFRREFVTLNGASPVTPVSPSYSGQTAYVRAANGGKVNLRNLPSYSGSSILAQFPTGTALTVLAQNGSFWTVQVQGMIGYMDSAFISWSGGVTPVNPVAPSQRPATFGTAIVSNPKATQYLNLRSQPSTSAKVVAQYKNGTRFEVIAPGEAWTKVYGAATGNIGYFMTKYLKLSGVSASPTKMVQNGGSYVNLRAAPSKATGSVTRQVPSGAVVTVLTPGDEWTQVRYGNTTGYMMTAFLK